MLLLLTDIVIFPAVVSIGSSLLFAVLLTVSLLYNCNMVAIHAVALFVYHCSYVDCYFLSVRICLFQQTLLTIIFVNIASVGVFFVCRMRLFLSVQTTDSGVV